MIKELTPEMVALRLRVAEQSLDQYRDKVTMLEARVASARSVLQIGFEIGSLNISAQLALRILLEED